MRELKVLWKAWITTLQTRLEYRVDLALGLAGALGMQVSGLCLMWVVLTHHGGDLAGWKPAEIGVLFGLTAMIQGCSELFFNHVWWTPTYIVRGQFDRLLVYPVRALPFFLMTCPELHAIGNIGGGLAVLCYSGHLAGLSPWGLLGLPLWLACGCLVHTSVLVLASTVVVKVKGSYNQLFWLTNTLLQNSRYPLSIYPGAVQAVLLVLVPFGLACFVPVSALTGRLPWALALGAPPVAAAIMVSLAWWAWEKAFQGYESTGS
jgi:ABC-2 type transport system permease protein